MDTLVFTLSLLVPRSRTANAHLRACTRTALAIVIDAPSDPCIRGTHLWLLVLDQLLDLLPLCLANTHEVLVLALSKLVNCVQNALRLILETEAGSLVSRQRRERLKVLEQGFFSAISLGSAEIGS